MKALIPDLLTRLKDPQEKYSLKSGLPSFLIQLSDGSPEVIGALLKLAKNEKEELLIRWTSLRSLEDIERSGEVLKQDLLHLALNDLSPVIQSQAWLTLARLQLHDDDILPALVKMGQGHYGHRHLINAGVVHTAFSPLSKALHTLMSMGQWKRTIPLFLDALDRIEDLIVLDSRRFAQYLVEHPDEAKPYVPRLLKIVARSPTNFQQVLARYSLLGALSRIVPRSPELREILEDLIKNPDDSGVKGVEKILRCIDPHAPLSVNGKYPCTGSWEMPSRKKIERKLKN